MNEREIFEQALDLPPSERREFVARVCAGEDDSRKRVERLLDAHERTASILDRPALATDDASFTRDDGEEQFPFLSPARDAESLGRLGHYEILNCIGQGEFGFVFRAFDGRLHRHVAIKVLKPELAASSIARERFVREARSAALINHEHVVQVYAVEESPIPYLVMEYVEGETLELRLRREGALAWKSVATLGAQIARGLAAAHARGLIHRDIKPGNVLLRNDRTDFAKITDFGLARTVDDAALSRSGLIVGTPRYMAPEQALGETIDSQADLFSLGSVLYEMASGAKAFPGETLAAVLQAVARAQPKPLAQVVAGLPESFYALIANLQERDPRKRRAAEAAAAVLEQEVGSADAVPRAARAKRTPAFAAAIGALLLATTIVLVGRNGWFDDESPVADRRIPPAPPRAASPTTSPSPTTPNATSSATSNDSVRPAMDGDARRADAPSEPNGSNEETSEREAPDRRGARFVLEVGGSAKIQDERGEQPLKVGDELPAGSWQLVEIDLEGCERVTNRGLKSFAGCKHLKRMTIQSNNVDDAGLDCFRGCDQLEEIDLSHTQVGDAGLVVFQDCRQLRELRLAGTKVTDDGLVYFSNCSQLKTLDLTDTKVTAKGLRSGLANVPLEKLFAPREIPLLARPELKQAFPACEISFSRNRPSRRD